MLREVGVLVVCLNCDSIVMLVVEAIDLKTGKGKGKGKGRESREELEDRWVRLQERFRSRKRGQGEAEGGGGGSLVTIACPTCIELCNGMRFQEYVSKCPSDWMRPTSAEACVEGDAKHSKSNCNSRSRSKPTSKPPASQSLRSSLTLCTPLSLAKGLLFEQETLPPLYLDRRPGGSLKPKWALVSGLGPPGVELDSSRSGRLHKPSLRTTGITAPVFRPIEGIMTSAVAYACEAIEEAVAGHFRPVGAPRRGQQEEVSEAELLRVLEALSNSAPLLPQLLRRSGTTTSEVDEALSQLLAGLL